MHSTNYTLLPADLRDPPETILGPLLASGTLKRSIPTLFISECVFVYMAPSASNAIVRWFSESFDIVGGMLYEMFGLSDNFGRMMRANLMVTISCVEYSFADHCSVQKCGFARGRCVSNAGFSKHSVPSTKLLRCHLSHTENGTSGLHIPHGT